MAEKRNHNASALIFCVVLVGFLQEKTVIIYVLPFGVSPVADMKDETVAEHEVVAGDKRMVWWEDCLL